MGSSKSSKHVLPAPGTLFDSPTALRLAIHKACLEEGCEMSVHHGGGFGGDSHSRVPTSDGSSFNLYYGRSGSKLKVTQTCEAHNICSAKTRKERAHIAREWAELKIAGLEAGLRLSRGASGSRGGSNEQEGEADDSDAEEVGTSSSSSCLGSSGAEEEQRKGTPFSPVEARTQPFEWPQISETARLAPPTVGDAFSSARDLLVQLHAFARQTGFIIHRRRRSDEDGSRVAIACSKGRRRSKSWTQVKFPRILEPERNAYDTYRLTRIVLRHDHTLNSPDDDAEPEHEETPNIASTSSFTPLAGTSYSCIAPSIFTTGRQPLPRFPRLQFDTAQALQPASPARPPPLAFFDDLKALISFLMPNLAPVLASRLASQLIGTGIRSISDLTNFLLFETDTTLPCFLRGLARREGDDVAEDAFSLFQLMRMYSMDSV